MTGYTHPAFEPYLDLLAQLDGRKDPRSLNEVSERLGICHVQTGQPLRFDAPARTFSAAQYEQFIADSGTVPTREDNLHDFLNALVWLRFPHLKSALNLRHCLMLAQRPGEEKQRGKLRDQLTLLDESGMLAVSSDAGLLELLRERKWVELFWEARGAVMRRMRFIVVGHGLLEKCLAPFPGMTAKCLFLHTPDRAPEVLDALGAASVLAAQALELPPLPLQGVPGWDDNDSRGYYCNTHIFRPARTPLPAA